LQSPVQQDHAQLIIARPAVASTVQQSQGVE